VLTAHGLLCHVTTPTHDRGGLLDVVASRADLQSPSVDVLDVSCSGDRRQSSGHVLSTHQRRADRGGNLTRLRSLNDCCRRPFVSQTRGRSTTLADSLRCMMKKLQQLLISSYPLRLSGIVARQIHGLTKIVGRHSVKLGDWNELLDEPTQMSPLPVTAAWTAQRRAYRARLRTEREEFWQDKVNSERSSPRELWRSVDALLCRGRVPPCDAINLTELLRRESSRRARLDLRCTSADVHIRSTWLSTARIQATDRRGCCRCRSSFASTSHPLPTRLIKNNVNVFASFLVELYNRSLSTGVVPTAFKAAYVTPLLLDPADMKPFRSISNHSVL